ncbi:MAG: hypothetical protein K0R02_487 [Rickettsiaceae bacterium]|jgi:endonuclease/exonuclease/phosphatase family metal-dependent hydrolase|nr:hypothetical protein [Rickettsiaceae bacterium]
MIIKSPKPKAKNRLKIVNLNIWGGIVRNPLLKFIEQYKDYDIFCLQEVYKDAQHKISTDDKIVSLNIFSEINALLPNHIGYFRSLVGEIFGMAIFINKKIKVLGEGELDIHINPNYTGRGPTHPRKLQWIRIKLNGKIYTVLNIHGLWNGMGKNDSPERILQSNIIRAFMDSLDTPIILCGDLNLRPDTESMRIIEKDMDNLVTIHNIKSTRTSYYDKPERFADYVLTSPSIKVLNFVVLPDEVSDHSIMLLEVEVEE